MGLARWAALGLGAQGSAAGSQGRKISPRGIWLGGQTKENCHLMRGSVDSGYRPTSVLGSHLLSSGETRSQRGPLAFWNEDLGRGWRARNTQ